MRCLRFLWLLLSFGVGSMESESFMVASVVGCVVGNLFFDLDHVVAFYIRYGYVSLSYGSYWDNGIPVGVARAWHTPLGVLLVALCSVVFVVTSFYGWSYIRDYNKFYTR